MVEVADTVVVMEATVVAATVVVATVVAAATVVVEADAVAEVVADAVEEVVADAVGEVVADAVGEEEAAVNIYEKNARAAGLFYSAANKNPKRLSCIDTIHSLFRHRFSSVMKWLPPPLI